MYIELRGAFGKGNNTWQAIRLLRFAPRGLLKSEGKCSEEDLVDRATKTVRIYKTRILDLG